MRTKESSAEITTLDSFFEGPDKVKVPSPEYLSQILTVVTHDNNKSNFNYFGTDGKNIHAVIVGCVIGKQIQTSSYERSREVYRG